MSFIDARFPTKIFSGTEASVGYNTSVIRLKSGWESRNANWEKELRRYDVTKAIQKSSEYQEILHFFLTVGKGTLNSFRFKDLADYKVPDDHNTSRSVLGTGDGITSTYQLIKTYVFGSTTYNRVITKPVAGTVKIFVNGVEKLSVDNTYGWSVDTSTGIITLTNAENWNGKIIGAEFEFDVPVRFEEDWLVASWADYQLFRTKISLVEERI